MTANRQGVRPAVTTPFDADRRVRGARLQGRAPAIRTIWPRAAAQVRA